MGNHAQIASGRGVALPAQILATHQIPQPEANIKTAIGQFGDAAGEQGFIAFLLEGREIGPGQLVHGGGQGIAPELAAALQICLDNG